MSLKEVQNSIRGLKTNSMGLFDQLLAVRETLLELSLHIHNNKQFHKNALELSNIIARLLPRIDLLNQSQTSIACEIIRSNLQMVITIHFEYRIRNVDYQVIVKNALIFYQKAKRLSESLMIINFLMTNQIDPLLDWLVQKDPVLILDFQTREIGTESFNHYLLLKKLSI